MFPSLPFGNDMKTSITLPPFSAHSAAARILSIPTPWLLAGFFLCLSLYLMFVPALTGGSRTATYPADSKHHHSLSLLPLHSGYSSYNPFSPSHSSPPSSPTNAILRAHQQQPSPSSSAPATPKRKPYSATHGRKWSTGKDLVREMEELLEEQEEEEARGLVCKGGRWTGAEKVDWGVKGPQAGVARQGGTVSPRRGSGMDPRGF